MRTETIETTIAALALTTALAGTVAASEPESLVCRGFAYIADPDRNGSKVRAAPHGSTVYAIPHDGEGSIVELSAGAGNWLRIIAVEGLDSGFRSASEGWIYAPLLAVRAAHPTGQKVTLYAEPDAGSAVVARVANDTEARLEGCQDNWRQVAVGRHKGWLAPTDYCWNPVTTCP